MEKNSALFKEKKENVLNEAIMRYYLDRRLHFHTDLLGVNLFLKVSSGAHGKSQHCKAQVFCTTPVVKKKIVIFEHGSRIFNVQWSRL